MWRHIVIGTDTRHRVTDCAARVQNQFLAVKRRAETFGRGIKLVKARSLDYANDRLSVFKNGNGNAPVWHAVDERTGAVDRIHDPGVARNAVIQPVFLPQKAILRKDFRHTGANELFDVPVSNRYHILRVALGFDNQCFTPLEIVESLRARLARDLFGKRQPRF